MKEQLKAANSEMSEGLANPIRINLQLFAEGEPPVEPTPSDPVPNDPPAESPVEPAQNPAPDVTQTQAFSQRLKESTTKAIDAEYDRLYGEQYGIHSKADYEAYLQKQEEEQRRQEFQETNGFDPNAVKPLFEQWKKNDPDFQELKRLKSEASVNAAIIEFSKEFPDLGVKELEDLNKLPNIDKITSYVQKGLTLNDAYKLANYNNITQSAQQEVIKKITANGESSPGSLEAGSGEVGLGIAKMPDKDFKKLQERVLRGENVNI